MGDSWPYWKNVGIRAAKETISNIHKKVLRGLAISVIAFSLQWWLFSLRNLTDTQKVCASLIGAAAIVAVTEFLWQLIRVPAKLSKEQHQEIAAKNLEIARAGETVKNLQNRLAMPARSPADQYHYDLAKAALEKHGPDAKTILVHLKAHGEIVLCPSIVPQLPAGMNRSDAERLLRGLQSDGLLNEKIVQHPVFPESVWTIARVMEGPLDELLYANSNSGNSQT